jgi:hypothetical protein
MAVILVVEDESKFACPAVAHQGSVAATTGGPRRYPAVGSPRAAGKMELAQRRGLPLATLDDELGMAAAALGLRLLGKD